MTTHHGLELDQDDEGWDVAFCMCGWTSPPVPGKEIAAECWADHRLVVWRDELLGSLEVEQFRQLRDDLTERRHAVEFRDDGWTVQHPLHERLDGTLFDCRVGFGHLAEPPELGRFWIEADGSLAPMAVSL